MACMVSLKHAPNGADSNFVPLFRNIAVSRFEWIRLYHIHVLNRDVIGGEVQGTFRIRHIPPNFFERSVY